MSSLASIVSARGPIKYGDPDGADVLVLQMALSQAGYRVGQDSQFGPRTQQVVKQFQMQHGLHADGIVGPLTAALLDAPHAVLVQTATPLNHGMGPDKIISGNIQAKIAWPHDDTASLLAFYGKPWQDTSLLVNVPVPFNMTYRDDDGSVSTVRTVRFHKKGQGALVTVLQELSDLAKSDPSVLKHVSHFSGSYNYRPVRGSARLSCHAFGAALDFDAEHLPLGRAIPASEMPQSVVDIFKGQGFFWGGDYTGRKDSMHFQLAHE